jgi:hypothetical protein
MHSQLPVPEQHPRKLRGAELLEARQRIHARKTADSVALCGAPAGLGQWATKRHAITCPGCAIVADQRIAAREKRRGRW